MSKRNRKEKFYGSIQEVSCGKNICILGVYVDKLGTSINFPIPYEDMSQIMQEMQIDNIDDMMEIGIMFEATVVPGLGNSRIIGDSLQFVKSPKKGKHLS